MRTWSAALDRDTHLFSWESAQAWTSTVSVAFSMSAVTRSMCVLRTIKSGH